MNLKELLKNLVNVFFPKICIVCKKKLNEYEFALCNECSQKLPKIKPPLCRICSLPLKNLNTSGLCSECYKNKPFFDKAISLFLYREPVKTIIHLLKYKHYTFLKEFFKEKIKENSYLLSNLPFEGITFIPMHPLKLKDREYNHAKIIAEIIAEIFRKPVIDAIRVKEYYRPQIRLNKRERKENIKGRFFAKDLNLKTILLVDDVLTTCSTVNEAAKVLKEKGIKKVYVFSLARNEIS